MDGLLVTAANLNSSPNATARAKARLAIKVNANELLFLVMVVKGLVGIVVPGIFSTIAKMNRRFHRQKFSRRRAMLLFCPWIF
jgi:hypothetical protein